MYIPEADRRSDDAHIDVNVKRKFYSDLPANRSKKSKYKHNAAPHVIMQTR
jgi:hypothetical protein